MDDDNVVRLQADQDQSWKSLNFISAKSYLNLWSIQIHIYNLSRVIIIVLGMGYMDSARAYVCASRMGRTPQTATSFLAFIRRKAIKDGKRKTRNPWKPNSTAPSWFGKVCMSYVNYGYISINVLLHFHFSFMASTAVEKAQKLD